MSVVYTIAGVTAVIFGLLFLVGGLGRAKKTTDGDVKVKDAATQILGGFLLTIGCIILFLQILASVGVGTQADDPYMFNWLSGLMKDLTTDKLPQLK